MIKHKVFFSNVKKEEEWINQIIAKGYRLKSLIPGRYQFEKLEPSDNTETFRPEKESSTGFLPLVRLDFRTFSTLEDFTDYVTLFEDCGWRHIAGNRSEGPQYFERTRPDSSDDIFSDSTSIANRYRRISNMQLGLFTLQIALIIVLSINITVPFLSFSSWKSLYHTPGLWEMSGLSFWGAFLFETPFALLRSGLLLLLLAAAAAYYGFWGLRSLYWYWKEKRDNK